MLKVGYGSYTSGQYREAGAIHRRELEGRENILGPYHPDTLASVSSIANALQRLALYRETEEMHQRALEGRERVLGMDHPDTLANVNDLGLALRAQD